VLHLFGDNDATVGAKAKVALDAGITPIICCGETIAERRAGQTDTIVTSQVKAALSTFSPEQVGWLVIAYEPVWAIGTGEVCDAPEAERVSALIRGAIGEVATSGSEAVRVLYGGSVKPDNAEELLAQPDIDGALVGGASLKLGQFAPIVRAARKTFRRGS
jgi:triosephosphate isomerase